MSRSRQPRIMLKTNEAPTLNVQSAFVTTTLLLTVMQPQSVQVAQPFAKQEEKKQLRDFPSQRQQGFYSKHDAKRVEPQSTHALQQPRRGR